MINMRFTFRVFICNDTLAYEATRPRDLGRTFGIYPDVAIRVTQMTLDQHLDGPYDFIILDFAECYGTTADLSPIEANVSRQSLLLAHS